METKIPLHILNKLYGFLFSDLTPQEPEAQTVQVVPIVAVRCRSHGSRLPELVIHHVFRMLASVILCCLVLVPSRAGTGMDSPPPFTVGSDFSGLDHGILALEK